MIPFKVPDWSLMCREFERTGKCRAYKCRKCHSLAALVRRQEEWKRREAAAKTVGGRRKRSPAAAPDDGPPPPPCTAPLFSWPVMIDRQSLSGCFTAHL